jgi:hypothetical protein
MLLGYGEREAPMLLGPVGRRPKRCWVLMQAGPNTICTFWKYFGSD